MYRYKNKNLGYNANLVKKYTFHCYIKPTPQLLKKMIKN